jgi:hypothetical protein
VKGDPAAGVAGGHLARRSGNVVADAGAESRVGSTSSFGGVSQSVVVVVVVVSFCERR